VPSKLALPVFVCGIIVRQILAGMAFTHDPSTRK